MGQTDLTLIIGSALMVAFVIGWILRWFFDRMNTTGPMASSVVTARMRAAETAQSALETQLRQTQTDARNVEMRLQAELDAAMDGLGAARREAESWRSETEAWRHEVEEIRDGQDS
ncbi:MAG: hypothetical protein V3V13_10230 [Paracoccaceae bacterium]